jgi:hypothetical protein
MRNALRFPIRLKILITMLVVVTGVVGAIVATMANLFHMDKKTYITDLVSMVTASTAEERGPTTAACCRRLACRRPTCWPTSNAIRCLSPASWTARRT